MFELTIALCHFANLYSLDLNCTEYFIVTESCQQSLVQLNEDFRSTKYFIKAAGCTKQIKHSKIKMTKDLM